MKLFTSDQLKMINRTYPITFTEDEFRLEEDLTYKRLYKRLNSLKDIELTNSYYLIHVKYRQYFRDRENEYLAKLYDIHHDVCENRGIDLRKYLRDVNKRKRNTDYISMILCILYALLLNQYTPLHIVIAITFALITFEWERVALFIARRINRKVIHVQQYKELPIMWFVASVILLILEARSNNSVIYLISGYAFLLLLHGYSIRILEKNVYKDLEKDQKKWKLIGRIYSAVMTILILIGIFNPFLDFIGTKFNTGSNLYFEGICTDVKDKWFGYKQATINGITVNLNTKQKDVNVGDYFIIQYGKHTRAVTKVIRTDVLQKFNSDREKDNTSMQEYLNKIAELEKNK